MAKLPIYNSFHPVLKKKTSEITEIDGSIKKLVENMFETMYNAEGIGLAANQVGVSQSLIIIDTAASGEEGRNHPPMILINPIIEDHSDDEVEMTEGCLSVPQFWDKVIRPVNIQVRYWDLNLKENVIEADEIVSRVIQHEIDHLNGILFYERLSSLRKTLAKNKLRKIQKGQVIPNYSMVMADGELVD